MEPAIQSVPMMYLIQIVAFSFVTWAGIHYEWTPNPYALGIVSVLGALLVTAIIVEIKLLPSRFARLHQRIFGLKDEPGREIASLPRSSWHGSNSLEDRSRLRIEKDVS
jgi:hypothetical protein